MSEKTPEQWIEFIAQQELPALTSTAKLLDKFANDDVSSLPRLSKAILHDQALSSCLLRVANSIQRIGVKKVTTVSRATVVLGIHTVKNICLTSKVIDSLIKNKSLDIQVFNKIKRLMACSFYAGQLAKMMIPEYSDDTKEEVYLAAMLYRIGETAFWSLDTHLPKSLNKLISLPKEDYEKRSNELIGMSFNELSVGLAKQWNLGELLVKSLDHPEKRTVEMQVIYLADKLAEYIDSPPSSQDFDQVISNIAKIMKVNERQLKHRIEFTRDNSLKLLNSYGAASLTEFIKNLPSASDFLDINKEPVQKPISKELAQLNALQELSLLANETADINTFIELTLKNISRILDFEICSFYLFSGDKKSLNVRFAFDTDGHKVRVKRVVKLRLTEDIFSKSLKENSPVLINDYNDQSIRKIITDEILDLISEGKVAAAPIQIDGNSIGLICALRMDPQNDISDDDFNKFSFFTQHLSMCLSVVNKRR